MPRFDLNIAIFDTIRYIVPSLVPVTNRFILQTLTNRFLLETFYSPKYRQITDRQKRTEKYKDI